MLTSRTQYHFILLNGFNLPSQNHSVKFLKSHLGKLKPFSKMKWYRFWSIALTHDKQDGISKVMRITKLSLTTRRGLPVGGSGREGDAWRVNSWAFHPQGNLDVRLNLLLPVKSSINQLQILWGARRWVGLFSRKFSARFVEHSRCESSFRYFFMHAQTRLTFQAI